jgi:hypothetical protein
LTKSKSRRRRCRTKLAKTGFSTFSMIWRLLVVRVNQTGRESWSKTSYILS